MTSGGGAADLLVAFGGKAVGGRYELRAPLGRGGFASVYSAWDSLDEKVVALKVLAIPAHLSEAARAEFVKRFQDEARLTRKVFQAHPNVIQVFDMGVAELRSEPLPWMAMELLEGETLGDALLRERATGAPPRTEAAAVALLRPALEAVAFGHARGIVHRDLKPQNLFLARGAAGPPTLKVLDFGIAKVVLGEEASSGETQTQSAFQMFSPAYGAPEQFSGKKTGKYTDVFALGLLFTELLTGAPPLGSDKTDCMMASVDRRQRPTPRERGVGISDALEGVILKAVAVKESERFPDAGALLEALATLPAASSSVTNAAPPLEPATTTSFTARVEEFRASAPSASVATTSPTLALKAVDALPPYAATSFADRVPEFVPARDKPVVPPIAPVAPPHPPSRARLGWTVGGVVALALLAAAGFGVWGRPSSTDTTTTAIIDAGGAPDLPNTVPDTGPVTAARAMAAALAAQDESAPIVPNQELAVLKTLGGLDAGLLRDPPNAGADFTARPASAGTTVRLGGLKVTGASSRSPSP